MRILVINGPNLNMLGYREAKWYGQETMEEVLSGLRAQFGEDEIGYFQSNHEGALIDKIHDVVRACLTTCEEKADDKYDGIVLNAGGYTHTSVALRDAVAILPIPVVEVHISNIKEREAFRQISLLSEVCQKTIMGIGTKGYEKAIEWIKEQGKKEE